MWADGRWSQSTKSVLVPALRSNIGDRILKRLQVLKAAIRIDSNNETVDASGLGTTDHKVLSASTGEITIRAGAVIAHPFT
jgi:hypothetical protein